jgi:hypothetical protein
VLECLDERVLHDLFRQANVAEPGSERSPDTGSLLAICLLKIISTVHSHESSSTERSEAIFAAFADARIALAAGEIDGAAALVERAFTDFAHMHHVAYAHAAAAEGRAELDARGSGVRTDHVEVPVRWYGPCRLPGLIELAVPREADFDLQAAAGLRADGEGRFVGVGDGLDDG